MEVVRMLYCIV